MKTTCCNNNCDQGRTCPNRTELNTRKFPRTLIEAFGPYTTPVITEYESDSYPDRWWAVMGVITVLSIIAVVVTA